MYVGLAQTGPGVNGRRYDTEWGTNKRANKEWQKENNECSLSKTLLNKTFRVGVIKPQNFLSA